MGVGVLVSLSSSGCNTTFGSIYRTWKVGPVGMGVLVSLSSSGCNTTFGFVYRTW